MHLSKTTELYSTKSEPYVNCGLEQILIYPYWLTIAINVPHYCKILIIEESVCRGEGCYGNSLHFLGNFSVTLRLI